MADSPPPLVPLPFDEAIAWSIAREVVLPDEYYGALQAQARSMAFSVSGIAQLDVLTAVKDSLTKVLEQGDSFGKWKKGVLSGEIPLQGLPAHRIENIFRTNIQSNYARGRCEQQRANYDSQPWLMYDAVNDARTRPAHSAMDGFVARYDDPVWNTWRTPNGYQCRCRLIALTERQAKQYILADQNRMQQPGMSEARTNAIVEGPDDGWDYDICREPMAGIESAVASRQGNVLGVDVKSPPDPEKS